MLLGYGVAPSTIQSLLPSDEEGGGVPPTACCKEPFSSTFHGEACGVLRWLIVSETVMARGACSTAGGALCVRARRARGCWASMSAMLRSLQMRDPNDRRSSCRGGLPEDARGLCGRRPAPGSAGDCHVAGSIDQLKFSRAGMPTSPLRRDGIWNDARFPLPGSGMASVEAGVAIVLGGLPGGVLARLPRRGRAGNASSNAPEPLIAKAGRRSGMRTTA